MYFGSAHRTIHVSHNKNSSDTKDCGSINQPCLQLDHAIDISQNGDVILLDASYSYIHNEAISIPHSLEISKYCGISTNCTTDKKPIVLLRISFYWMTLFSVEGNFTISSVSIELTTRIDSIHLFNCNGDSMKTIEMIDCDLRNMNHIYQELFNKIENVAKVTLHGVYFGTGNTKSSYSQSRQMVKSIHGDVSLVVNISHCTLVDSSLTIFTSRDKKNGSIIDVFNLYMNNSAISVYIGSNSQANFVQNQLFASDMLLDVSSFRYHDHNFNDTMTLKKSEGNITDCNFTESNVQISNEAWSQVTMKGSRFRRSSLWVTHNSALPFIFNMSKSTFEGFSEGKQFMAQIFEDTINTKAIYIEGCQFTSTNWGAVYIEGFSAFLIDTDFIDNNILDDSDLQFDVSAVLTVFSDEVTIHNCKFLNNSSPSSLPNSIYIKMPYYNDGKRMRIQDLNLSNITVLSGAFRIEKQNLVVFIKPEFDMGFETPKINVTISCYHHHNNIMHFKKYVKVLCAQCDGTSYNALNKSSVGYNNKGDLYVHNSTCYQCPLHAFCIDGTKSKGNYWGYSNTSGYLTFKLCPPFYCCDHLKTCLSYNTCMNRRQGRLCGGCRPGDSISIFSHNKCVETEKCKAGWFWIVCTSIFLCLTV